VGEELFSFVESVDPLIGRILDGRYEVLERLGTGAEGVVYRGKQVQLGRFVAIKMLQPAAQPEVRKRFQREAKALSELAHPNIVGVTDSGIDGDVPYLVMELLEGKTLADLLAEGPLPFARSLGIAQQLLRGLSFAHGKGIVHRDLTPAHVFLQELPDHQDHVRLFDFGVAKFLDTRRSSTLVGDLTRIGVVVGTPAYMSPEQAREEAVDARTDVYAAGVVLFELFGGRPPFAARTRDEMQRAHATEPVPSLAEARPDLPVAPLLQPIIERAMFKNRAGRFPDAASMLTTLEAIAAVSRVANSATPVSRRASPEVERRRFGRLWRAWSVITGSWKSVVTVVSVAAGLSSVITFVRRDIVKSSAGATASLSFPAAAGRGSPRPGELAPRPAPRDPWRDPAPGALQPIRDKLNHQARLSETALRPVYTFARQNPGDARPWLLVAGAYAQLDWWSDSVDRYLRAYRLDASCRGDPRMLADLLKAVAHPVAGRSAARAVHAIYGADALPAIGEERQRHAGDRDAIARLDHLADELAH
jgi:eukaryotic-like serine/threonine-protein kinase